MPKTAARIGAYGCVDELNAVLGLALDVVSNETERARLGVIQNDLFDLGADLCTPEEEDPPYPPLRMTAAQVTYLEQEIDRLNADLQPLKTFVLPGGTVEAEGLESGPRLARVRIGILGQ